MKLKMNYLNNYYNKCLNLIIDKELKYNKFQIKFIILKIKKNLNKNLIFKKDNFQDKEILEK